MFGVLEQAVIGIFFRSDIQYLNRYTFRVEKIFSSKELSQLFSNTTMNFLHKVNISTRCKETRAKSM